MVTRAAIPAGNARAFGRGLAPIEVVGYDYNVTFVRNNGDVHDLVCEQGNANLAGAAHPYRSTNDALSALPGSAGKQCGVSEWTERPHTDGVFLRGDFTLSLPFPHFQQAYDRSNGAGGVRANFTTRPLRFDAPAAEVKAAMEAVVDDRSGTRVFGTVAVSRAAYTPSADSKWSGQSTWVVTFLTRPGDVPRLAPDGARRVLRQPQPDRPARQVGLALLAHQVEHENGRETWEERQ